MLTVLLNSCFRRYAPHYTAVGTAFYTTARVNAARYFSAVGVGVMPFTAVDAALKTPARVNAACFSAVGVSVMLPILLLLVPPFTLRRG